ncbi:EpsG family protein [Flavonifractor sp. An52]|uniref:EpsG family protein n=1 Tax=Flavonifractor sp. An52 TaxID=1965642 RepID=UPI001179E696|nr:EpsG family protein [Flavonifractor sp. An52]
MSFVIVQRDRELSFRRGKSVKEKQFTVLLILGLGIFTGLRVFGNDTATYIRLYNYGTPILSDFIREFNVSFTDAIGFSFINSLLKTLGASSQDFIMVYGLATMILYVTFLHHYSESFPFSMYLFFFFGGFLFAQAAIKQSMAMAISCWSFHFAVKQDWKKFIITVAISSLFHPFAVIYFLMPFMTFRPWTGMSYLWIVGSILIGLSLDSLLGAVVDITALMGASYGSDEFSGEGVNIFRVLVCLVPTVFSYLFRKKIYCTDDKATYLMMNLTMLNGLIMFVGLFGTANYFARLANFFIPFQLIALPWIINRIGQNNRKVVYPIALIGYLMFCMYENVILRPFDAGFEQISLWEYLKGLFV